MGETLVLAPVAQERPMTNVEQEIVELQREFMGYYATMKIWAEDDNLGSAFQQLSGYSARASEVRGLLNRSSSAMAQKFRTRQVEPFIEECDRQFRILSRIQACRQFDWDMAKGGT